MGYFIENLNIADITLPSTVSLSGNPNYIIIEKKTREKIPATFTLKVIAFADNPHNIGFTITENNTGTKHQFFGAERWETPGEGVQFFTLPNVSLEGNAQNIAYALKVNSYISANFDIITNKNQIILTSKSYDSVLFSYYSENSVHQYLESSVNPSFPANDYPVDITFQVTEDLSGIEECSVKFVEKETNISHEFKGTIHPDKINDNTFLIEQDPGKTANNLRQCLQKDPFFGVKFNCGLPFKRKYLNSEQTKYEMVLNDYIRIQSRGMGKQYSFTYNSNPLLIFKTGSSYSNNNDSISTGETECELQLEIYRNNGGFPGRKDSATKEESGEYVTTLTKAYFGEPVWFNINSIVKPGFSYDVLFNSGWHNPKTVEDIRLIAYRHLAGKKEVFYVSDTLYQLNGYDRTLEKNDMSAYVYDTADNNTIKPLTTQPELFHVEGQAQFFNFLLCGHDNTLSERLGIMYKLYSQSGRILGEKTMHIQAIRDFNMINTIKLDIDKAISEHSNVGIVEVYLSRALSHTADFSIVSHPLTFRILPPCLHKVNDFAFLNRLGGWSSFNFAGTEENEFKATANTFHRTQLPGFDKSSQLEAVYNKTVEEKFTVQSMPVTREVAEWLKELSSSKAVYELSTGRYVIVDELTIKPNSKDDLFRLDMKYRYSDMYN